MILHCGPTGSGKSMTLYSALNEINTPDIVIRTAEDPIEYTLPGINQMQMHRQIGLTFAAALRSFLRQDPDIILVGEIRDKETASIAVEAALTGHLLISTLHTNDAPEHDRASHRHGHRAVHDFRRRCSACAPSASCAACARPAASPTSPRAARRRSSRRRSAGAARFTKPIRKGCPKCGGSGYKGRLGIHELMVNNEELIEAHQQGVRGRRAEDESRCAAA